MQAERKGVQFSHSSFLYSRSPANCGTPRTYFPEYCSAPPVSKQEPTFVSRSAWSGSSHARGHRPARSSSVVTDSGRRLPASRRLRNLRRLAGAARGSARPPNLRVRMPADCLQNGRWVFHLHSNLMCSCGRVNLKGFDAALRRAFSTLG